jgi:hypothetical protein
MSRTYSTYVYSIFVGKPKGKTPVGRPRHRWEDNIKIDLGEIGWAIRTGLIWFMVGTSDGTLGKW